MLYNNMSIICTKNREFSAKVFFQKSFYLLLMQTRPNLLKLFSPQLQFYHNKLERLVLSNISTNIIQWGSVNHQMAVPVPSISCCIFINNYFFYQEPNELAFNRHTCCHLVICLWLIASHCYKGLEPTRLGGVPWVPCQVVARHGLKSFAVSNTLAYSR